MSVYTRCRLSSRRELAINLVWWPYDTSGPSNTTTWSHLGLCRSSPSFKSRLECFGNNIELISLLFGLFYRLSSCCMCVCRSSVRTIRSSACVAPWVISTFADSTGKPRRSSCPAMRSRSGSSADGGAGSRGCRSRRCRGGARAGRQRLEMAGGGYSGGRLVKRAFGAVRQAGA